MKPTIEDVLKYNREIKDALQFLYDSITAQGQRKKLLKNEKVKALLDKYGVVYEEE